MKNRLLIILFSFIGLISERQAFPVGSEVGSKSDTDLFANFSEPEKSLFELEKSVIRTEYDNDLVKKYGPGSNSHANSGSESEENNQLSPSGSKNHKSTFFLPQAKIPAKINNQLEELQPAVWNKDDLVYYSDDLAHDSDPYDSMPDSDYIRRDSKKRKRKIESEDEDNTIPANFSHISNDSFSNDLADQNAQNNMHDNQEESYHKLQPKENKISLAMKSFASNIAKLSGNLFNRKKNSIAIPANNNQLSDQKNGQSDSDSDNDALIAAFADVTARKEGEAQSILFSANDPQISNDLTTESSDSSTHFEGGSVSESDSDVSTSSSFSSESSSSSDEWESRRPLIRELIFVHNALKAISDSDDKQKQEGLQQLRRNIDYVLSENSINASISEDQIRLYLRQGKEYLPDDKVRSFSHSSSSSSDSESDSARDSRSNVHTEILGSDPDTWDSDNESDHSDNEDGESQAKNMRTAWSAILSPNNAVNQKRRGAPQDLDVCNGSVRRAKSQLIDRPSVQGLFDEQRNGNREDNAQPLNNNQDLQPNEMLPVPPIDLFDQEVEVPVDLPPVPDIPPLDANEHVEPLPENQQNENWFKQLFERSKLNNTGSTIKRLFSWNKLQEYPQPSNDMPPAPPINPQDQNLIVPAGLPPIPNVQPLRVLPRYKRNKLYNLFGRKNNPNPKVQAIAEIDYAYNRLTPQGKTEFTRYLASKNLGFLDAPAIKNSIRNDRENWNEDKNTFINQIKKFLQHTYVTNGLNKLDANREMFKISENSIDLQEEDIIELCNNNATEQEINDRIESSALNKLIKIRLHLDDTYGALRNQNIEEPKKLKAIREGIDSLIDEVQLSHDQINKVILPLVKEYEGKAHKELAVSNIARMLKVINPLKDKAKINADIDAIIKMSERREDITKSLNKLQKKVTELCAHEQQKESYVPAHNSSPKISKTYGSTFDKAPVIKDAMFKDFEKHADLATKVQQKQHEKSGEASSAITPKDALADDAEDTQKHNNKKPSQVLSVVPKFVTQAAKKVATPEGLAASAVLGVVGSRALIQGIAHVRIPQKEQQCVTGMMSALRALQNNQYDQALKIVHITPLLNEQAKYQLNAYIENNKIDEFAQFVKQTRKYLSDRKPKIRGIKRLLQPFSNHSSRV